MNPAYDYDDEFPVSIESRTSRELAANRRRFAREGVAVSSGSPSIAYRATGAGGTLYSVRPAARALHQGTAFDHVVDRVKDSLIDALERVSQIGRAIRRLDPFRLIGGAAIGVTVLVLVAVAVAQSVHFAFNR